MVSNYEWVGRIIIIDCWKIRMFLNDLMLIIIILRIWIVSLIINSRIS